MRADVIYLVAESPTAHGVFDRPTKTKRMVYCEVASVGYSEFYSAKSAGIEPEIVFKLSQAFEYNGEKIVEYNGTLFRVIRTYVNGDSIEITCGGATNDR